MAACAATSRVATGVPSLSAGSKKVVSRAVVQPSCFAALRSSCRVDGLKSSRLQSFSSRTAVAKSVAKTTCGLDTPLVISLSTGALLFLGRFVFLPFQRDNVSGWSFPPSAFIFFFGNCREACNLEMLMNLACNVTSLLLCRRCDMRFGLLQEILCYARV